MGLKLAAPNGAAVTTLHQWALRCEACAFITREVGRAFCPKCGNMNTLRKIRMEVDEEGGVEFVAGRQRPILRGTRYSIPLPKGGRDGKGPVLREDMVPRRQARGKKAEIFDAFAPEYGEDTWHQAHAVNQKLGAKGAAFAASPWKNNPNERAWNRTNRRK